jgi:hypothetical protein
MPHLTNAVVLFPGVHVYDKSGCSSSFTQRSGCRNDATSCVLLWRESSAPVAVVARQDCLPAPNSKVTPHQPVRDPPILEAGVKFLQSDYYRQARLEGRCNGSDYRDRFDVRFHSVQFFRRLLPRCKGGPACDQAACP